MTTTAPTMSPTSRRSPLPTVPSGTLSPSLPHSNTLSPKRSLECDYDVNPTYLYQAIEAQQWNHVSSGKFFGDQQAATWVTRKEPTGKLRWRLLPLHAAVIFKAPLFVIELLLQEYPAAAACKDDQGMLPLHLAFRNEADWEVMEELLTAHPNAIHVKDRKGRLPLQCACSSLKKITSVLELYTQIALGSERQRNQQESQRLLESRTQGLQETHIATLSKLKEEWQIQHERTQLELLSTQEALSESQKLMRSAREEASQAEQTQQELTLKLTQVTQALSTVGGGASAATLNLVNSGPSAREVALQRSNEELLVLVNTLLNQQTSLKVQLDQQAWTQKNFVETSARELQAWKEQNDARHVALEQTSQEWRSTLEQTQVEASQKLASALELLKVADETQESSKPANGHSPSSRKAPPTPEDASPPHNSLPHDASASVVSLHQAAPLQEVDSASVNLASLPSRDPAGTVSPPTIPNPSSKDPPT